tara:strand:- start:123 stop:302 length:180 start_codon:yes stop_codon:yes gene_type:complete
MKVGDLVKQEGRQDKVAEGRHGIIVDSAYHNGKGRHFVQWFDGDLSWWGAWLLRIVQSA